MKFGVVTFPGSNCDEDMIHVLETTIGQPVEKLWHKDHDLKGVDMVVLPGGFSFGDYLRSGAIARFSPIMQEVVAHAKKGGLVFGVCNGFQVLCEAGLVPGALLHNEGQKFMAQERASSAPRPAIPCPHQGRAGQGAEDPDRTRRRPLPCRCRHAEGAQGQ
jgi:phosphoribosylformylglycinamidine synthase I